MAEPLPVSAVAVGGKVRILFDEPRFLPEWSNENTAYADLTPEEADAFWNQVAEAELVALEQRVRARRRVTEGARGGWVNAPAQGRHALIESQWPAVRAEQDRRARERHAVDAGMALAESTTALDLLTAARRAASLNGFWPSAAAAPEPGDPAPDYQHPEPGDGEDGQ